MDRLSEMQLFVLKHASCRNHKLKNEVVNVTLL